MPKRVMFTGGSGKAGRHVLAYLAAHGYELLNIDLAPLDQANLKTRFRCVERRPMSG